ncbi:hypothetical protein [Picrophilus oshimae]|uniref:hypothetical protein n=1 Tax=Picrophilus oshimae TaxID=46632 RepID=UPI001293A18F|nr:hypothetical protein [Picrophilus oshimae]
MTKLLIPDRRFTLYNSLKRGLPMLVIPPLLLVIILYSKNFYLLEYLHVVSGSM